MKYDTKIINIVKLILIATIILIAYFVIFSPSIYASPYGSSTYGVCEYSRDCPTTTAEQLNIDDNPQKTCVIGKDCPETAGVKANKEKNYHENVFVKALSSLGNKIPVFIAKTFPFWLLILLLALATRIWWQAIRETISLKRIQTIIEKELAIENRKKEFVMITSHYLLTPLTLIKNGAEMLKDIDYNLKNELIDSCNHLDKKVNEAIILTKNDQGLALIPTITTQPIRYNTLKSIRFWLPVILVLSLLIIINLLLKISDRSELIIASGIMQIIIVFVAATFLYLAIRTHKIKEIEVANSDATYSYNQAISNARNAFIIKVADSFREGISALQAVRSKITETNSTKFFDKGLSEMASTVYKIELASLIENGNIGQKEYATINIREFIDGAINSMQTVIASKSIIVNNDCSARTINHDLVLYGFVVKSVVENAIKFSKEHGNVRIFSEDEENRTRITVIDDGVGMNKEYIQQLFNPFTRGSSTETYDYEGMGFSLYLTKLIIDHFGGDISIKSSLGNGTEVTFVL